MAIPAAVAVKPVQGPAPGRRVWRAVVVIMAAGLIAFLAFLAGEHQHPVTVLTGVADVGGDHTASVTVAGSSWVYGISGVDQWVDQQGQTHLGGWPACLSTPGKTVPVTFGWVPVTAPGGSSWRQVVWIDCRS
ncbi:MAG TPA: hypothetical protein VIX15_01765 [Streptosporangiaceae bacterium]